MKKRRIKRLCAVAGCALIAGAAVLTAIWQLSIRRDAEQTREHAALLRQLLPQNRAAVQEARTDTTMPVLCLDGVDYVGLMEFPSQDAALPVRADWLRDLSAPCVFSGSLYDGSLIVGAGSQSGQMEFYARINPGDALYFTDMTGCCYAFTIERIEYREHADEQTLTGHEADLTVFIKNQQAIREYILLFCTAADS